MRRTIAILLGGFLAAAAQEKPTPTPPSQEETIVLPDPSASSLADMRIVTSDGVEKAHMQALADGRKDLAAGKLVHIGYGLAVEKKKMEELMRARYGIEMREKGCVVFPSDEAYAHVYNALMEEAISKKFGHSFEELLEPVWKEITSISPNQPPLRMPVSGTPAADAPVAPPPGIAGR